MKMIEEVPDVVKVAYGIISPIPVVFYGAVFTVKHVGESVGHIVKGSVRLAWDLSPLSWMAGRIFSPPVLSNTVTIDPPSSTESTSEPKVRGISMEVVSGEAKRNPRKVVAPRPLNNSQVHGCQFGPDSPDPRARAYPGGSPIR